LAAVFVLLFVSLLFRLFRGDAVAEAAGDLPFGIAVILGLSFLAIRIGFDIVPLIWEHVRGEARDADETVTFGMEEDGLSIDSKRMSATLGWAMFASIRATPERLYFFLSRRSALMMPRRCFANEADFKRWIAYSEQRWTDSKDVE
jgi:hypothetical protein